MKALKWIVVLLVLAGIAAGAYLLLPRPRRTPAGTSLLPPDTFLFLQVPDLPRSKAEFRTTALYKIWSEKEVQDFLGKSVGSLRAEFDKQVGDTPYLNLARRAGDLASGELFVAVTELRGEKRRLPPLVFGTDVKDRRAQADQWIADLRAQLKKDAPGFREESSSHGGVRYTRWTSDTTTICHAYFGSLLVATSNEDALRGMIERYNDAASPSLATDERYRGVVRKMPSAHAALGYCNPQPLVALLKGFALFMPQVQSAVANLDAMRAIGYTTTFNGGSFHDVFFVAAPADRRGDLGGGTAPTQRKSLPLTSESALFYQVQCADLGKMWEEAHQRLQENPLPIPQLPGAAAALPSLSQVLSLLEHLDRQFGFPKSLLEAVGPEYAFSLSWETNAPFPELFVALEVRDKAKAGAALDKLWQFGQSSTNLTEAMGMGNLFTDTPHDGQMIHSLQAPMMPINPSYVVTERFVLLTSQAETARRLLGKLKNGGKSLADSAAYQQTMNALPAGAHSYVYLDTRTLFERAYEFVRPKVQRAAARVPMLDEYVDFGKLPSAQTIGRHLQPSVAAQVVDREGFTTVVISPVGMPAVAAVAAVGAGVAVAQQFPNFPMK